MERWNLSRSIVPVSICFRGRWNRGQQPVKKGDHFILPNGYGKVEMQGKMSLIVSTVK